MRKRLDTKIRLLLISLLLIAFGVMGACRRDPAPAPAASTEAARKELAEPQVHPKSPATDFYEEPLLADPPPLKEVRFTPAQVSRESILFMLILSEGDLLADYCLLTAREFVDEEQLVEARAIAREYDVRLKDLRRERSQILEQAGISIKDPSERLSQLREKAFRVFCEVNHKIMTEVLTAEQRKQILKKAEDLQAANKAAKKAAAAKSEGAAARNGN